MTIKINFSSPFTTKPENQILLLHKILWLVAKDALFVSSDEEPAEVKE